MASDNNDRITVCILIPTYNRSDYLEKALSSAAGQTYRKLEIIVIDNGTADAARNLIADLNDTRVRYLRNDENIRLIGSIRKGMGLFSNRVSWCTILPDDDLLDRDFVRSMVDYVNRHPGVAVAHGHRILIDAAGKQTGETSIPPERETAVEYLTNRSSFIRQSFLAGVFFSRSAYERIGGYPAFTTGMASDDALIFALAMTQGLYFNGHAVAMVRMHSEAESHSDANVAQHIRAFEDFRDYLTSRTAQAQLPASDLQTINRVLHRYMRTSISGLWVRRVQSLLSGAAASHAVELAELYNLVGRRNLPFSLRVEIDAFLATHVRWCPESSPRYRLWWDSLSRWKARLMARKGCAG